jgi:hypothetical protein
MIKLLTVAWAMGFTAIICYVWWGAAFNHNSIIITINTYGEKFPEMVLGFFLIPLMIYGFILFIQEFISKRKRIRKSMLALINKERIDTL